MIASNVQHFPDAPVRMLPEVPYQLAVTDSMINVMIFEDFSPSAAGTEAQFVGNRSSLEDLKNASSFIIRQFSPGKDRRPPRERFEMAGLRRSLKPVTPPA